MIEVGRPEAALAGVAGREGSLFAAISAARPKRTTTIAAFGPASAPAWQAELDGFGGPLAVIEGAGSATVVAALGGVGAAGGIALRGEPGAALIGLDAGTGAARWKLAIDATEWTSIAAIAATKDGVVVGGSFSGTLRIADTVVSSGGRTDGFVARISEAGALRWLLRLGGPGGDSVAGVAVAGDRLAIAGTFAAGADLLGEPLAAADERSVHADGFVAELDAAGARRWVRTFGGKADDAVNGVAIDAAGRIAVAATVRDTVAVNGAELVAAGDAAGLVAWWLPGGGAGPAVLLGDAELEGLRGIAAAGERVVVAGAYRTAITLGGQALRAVGGDDAFLAELDPSGAVTRTWPIAGDGREEVTALVALPGAILAGVAHTAGARVGLDTLPSPTDPMAGAALVLRGLR